MTTNNGYHYSSAPIFNLTDNEVIKILDSDTYLKVQNISNPGTDNGFIPNVDLPIEDAITTMKAYSTGAIGCIPVVGALVAGIAGLFLPDSMQTLEANIRKEMEAVINQRFNAYNVTTLKSKLLGLSNNSRRYALATSAYLKKTSGDRTEVLKQDVRNTFSAYLSNLELSLPSFKSAGYEVLSLPFFAIVANMHLSALRDVALNGQQWGVSNAQLGTYKQDLMRKIEEYVNYVRTTYMNGLRSRGNDDVITKPSYENGYPDFYPARNIGTYRWNYMNEYKSYMRRNVLDLSSVWLYYNTEKYPGQVNFEQIKPIYSSIVGVGNIGSRTHYYKPYNQIYVDQLFQGEPKTVASKVYDSTTRNMRVDVSAMPVSNYANGSFHASNNLENSGYTEKLTSVKIYTELQDHFVLPVAYDFDCETHSGSNRVVSIGTHAQNCKYFEAGYKRYRVWNEVEIDTDNHLNKPEGMAHALLGTAFEFRPYFIETKNILFTDRTSVFSAEKSHENHGFMRLSKEMFGGDAMQAVYRTGYITYKVHAPEARNYKIRLRVGAIGNVTTLSTYHVISSGDAIIGDTTVNIQPHGIPTDFGRFDLYEVGTVHLTRGENEIKICSTSFEGALISNLEFIPV